MDSFPLPRGTAMALIRLTQREGTSLAVMAHALKADPTLSVRAIRVSNGVAGGDHGPVVSLRDAVNVLGVPAVRSLAMGFALMASHRDGPCRGFDYTRFWSQALARAVALQLLTGARPGCPAAEAFSVGLLARVGELALAAVYPVPYAELLRRCAERPELTPAQCEREEFAVTHAELSASMLADYNLADDHVAAVESFELPALPDLQEGDGDRLARRLLVLADHIAGICVAVPERWRQGMPRLFQLGSGLAFGTAELVELCDRTAHEWREWGTLLGIDTGPMPHFEDCQPPAPLEAPVAAPIAAGAEPARASILVVGDEARLRLPLRPLLAATGHRVVEAADGRQGLAMAIEMRPQIMLVDVLAAEVDGLELTRSLRQFKSGRGIYLLAVSAANDDTSVARAFEAGADGVLSLPLKPQLLAASLRAGMRMASLQDEIARDQEDIRRISAELAVSNRQLQDVGMTDLLTGCRNRRYAMDRLQQEWAMANRNQRPLACMVVDMDNLKQINDAHGHVVGDNALKLVASAFKDEIRAQEVLARSGGDEFMVICPDTTLEAALACAERMRAAVEALPVVGSTPALRGSVSIGVAVRDATTPTPDALIGLADQGAYLAKRRRNAVATVQTGSESSRAAQA
ncbi:diguanylate cyclase [Sulfuritalea sp.]|uniref:sensor domain-containing diguanylate cyclase n=1 Tax=Sulfuritalea sp. TaxID=2480090 RepID=UPI001AD4E03B|nr:diguanylate cyclase [Sulfuritalea sp.]MBN8476946.1 diguanylate cyclase [Sulfuritalea sp.]